MRLISLQLINYRVFKRLNLDFEDRVIGIIGPNGAGKSSIIEAISYALYGNQVSRSGRDEIKSSLAGRDETCEVRLDFSVNEEKYRVVRRIVGRSQKAEVELFRGDSADSIGVTETRQYIGQLLGLDWRGFLTSFLARQQELNALSDLQPSRRRDHLAGMLGIERLDRALNLAKEDGRRMGEQAGFVERSLHNADAVTKRVTELVGIERENAAVTEREAILGEQARSRLSRADRYFQKGQKEQTRWIELKSSVQSIEKTGAAQKEQLKRLREEAGSLDEMEREAGRLKGRLEGLPEVRREVDALKKGRAMVAVADDLVSQDKKTSDQIGAVKIGLATATEQLDEIKNNLGDIGAEVEKAKDKSRADLDKASEEFSRLMAEKAAGEAEINKLGRQVASVAQFGPESICDRCLRPLGNDLGKIRSHLADELARLEEIDQRQAVALEAKKHSLTILRTETDKLTNDCQRRSQLLIEKKAVEKETQSLASRQKELEQQAKSIQARRDELGEVAFDAVKLTKSLAELEELTAAQTRLDRTMGALSRRSAVADETKSTEAKIQALRDEADEVAVELEKLGFDQSGFEASSTELEAARAEFDKVRERYRNVAQQLEVTRTELGEKRRRLDEYEKTKVELEQLRSGRFYAEKLAGLFGEFRRHLIGRIRPTLAEISSRLFHEMTEGKYGMVELDEKYNLRLFDYGQFYGVERFSGGEKDLANLCLRLAISQALTESAGLSGSFIILDEVFGSQDSGRKDLIISALGRLKNRFPQILLVTHIEEIKDRVEQLIEVIPTGNGWSEVRVNGG